MSPENQPKEEFPTEDYLDEDKPLRHSVKKQNWVVLSMLTPNCFPESKREQYKDQKILGIKVRGVYEEYSEAAARAEQLQKIDKFHHVFVGELGKWLPFDVDVSNMGSEDQVYREKSLNKYMKSYKEALHEEEVDEKQRKEEMLQGANVVTGKHSAPINPELGVVSQSSASTPTSSQLPTPTDTTAETPSLSVENSSSSASTPVPASSTKPDNTLGELETNETEKKKLQEQLENTKASLVGLEDKLSAINELYAKLKSN
jgi:hypothetical protein